MSLKRLWPCIRLTFDGVCLGQLGTIRKKIGRYVVPAFAVSQSDVDMGAGQIVDVELVPLLVGFFSLWTSHLPFSTCQYSGDN
jgi:hypothetical protein